MTTGQTRLLWLLLALLLAASLPAAAHAQDDTAPVRVDGRTIFRVGPADDADAATRANRIESRLETLLDNPRTIAPAVIEASRPDEKIVTVSGVPIVTVTETDAENNLTTVDALAAQWAAAIDNALAEGRERRVGGGSEVLVLIEGAAVRLLESAREILPRAIATVVVLLLFGLVAAVVRRLMRLLFRVFLSDQTLENLLTQIIYYSIWVLGIIIAVNALGFDPQSLATGLGLTSLALGFALQDILSNFISGLLILVLRPFELNDQIVIGDTEGSVEQIDLRATRIRTYDGRLVLVPNAELFTSRVTNNTAAPVRRSSILVTLGYEADLARAATVMLAATREADGVLETPPPSTLFREMEHNTVAIEVRFWTDSRRSDYLATSSNVRLELADALKREGFEPANPALLSLDRRGQDALAAEVAAAADGK
jgi:small-conductance mechanosensitive channel